MEEAEEHTLSYYCIPPHRWQNLRYDLVTRQDNEWEPLPEATLARLQRLHHFRPLRDSAYDFFRIQLNDPGILNVAKRESLEPDLYSFLLYILTHEMVHLVRLSTILPDELEVRLATEEEESRVERVAYRILSNRPDLCMGSILNRFYASEVPGKPTP
jgi:hypothetical protein